MSTEYGEVRDSREKFKDKMSIKVGSNACEVWVVTRIDGAFSAMICLDSDGVEDLIDLLSVAKEEHERH